MPYELGEDGTNGKIDCIHLCYIVWDEYDMGVVYLNKNSEYSDEVMKAFEFIEAVYGYNFDKEEGVI